ncbi:ABC transporter permease [Fulvimarina sp. 2208YS6-2-32]|uniref:ABC transporter permease n=1 Tax=Fulvimarina uroteuthidis TaxID=3098149 RepID=A0ABU5I491_9HYPH|nr:ABC transporter permease [Fulvimarina sp. 2208YS6-2-32]MDY8110207.1 ABC transporter permease [Fulvimarina sp. 2208YS6-2-32]
MNVDWLMREWDMILDLFLRHLWLSVAPVAIGLGLALPIGWAVQRSGRWKGPILNLVGLLFTIPSLALFVLLPWFLGTQILDPLNVIVALTIYVLALLVRTVADGLDAVPRETLQAANAMGFRPLRRLLTIELPLAIPVIAGGLRVALVSNISIVSVAALVGTRQLGSLFTQGLQLQFLTPIIIGIVLSLLLAATLDALVLVLSRRMTPWERRNA